jgi:hypothetical protein
MIEAKRGWLVIAIVLALLISLTSVSALDYSRLQRFWDASELHHFYTSSKEEAAKAALENPDFISEPSLGYIYSTQIPETVPLYRLWNSAYNSHLFTTDISERDSLAASGWVYEKIEGYVYSSEGENRVPLHRYHHTIIRDNFYTTNELEKWKIDTSFPDYQYVGIEGYLKNKTLSDESQVIMMLYAPNNSHSAVWNYQEVYQTFPGECLGPVGACQGLEQAACEADSSCVWQEEYDIYRKPGYPVYYDEIFGYPYEGDNPHACTGSNKVLELYQDHNSHAQVPGGPLAYGTDVCYGDLECEVHVDPDPCQDNSRVIVRLYDDTNSHVSNSSVIAYPRKICCKTDYFPTSPEVYFANMRGERIDEADIGDTVLLIYGHRAGAAFDFHIKEDDPLFDDDIETLGGYDLNGNYVAKWTITSEDYLSGGDEEKNTFYFEVNTIKSNEINVSRNSEGRNSMPNAVITQPSLSLSRENRRFKSGDEITFLQNCWDEDDTLKITWELGDGTVQTCTWPDQNCDTVYQYSDSGTQEVYLRAEEIGRGRKASDYTEVYVYDGDSDGEINLFPIISEPVPGTPINNKSIPLRFNASESYVSYCRTGSCPVASCYGVDDLFCYDYSKSDIGRGAGQYDLWFNWSFSDGNTRYGNWTGHYIDAVDFLKYFYQAKKYTAKLNMGFEQY